MADKPSRVRNPLAFLFGKTRKTDLMADYVIREHRRGRSLDEILKDPHVVNTCSPEEIRRLLDSPAIVHAVGEDVIAARRTQS